MSEIKNPEKQIEKQPVQETPEKLRDVEARKSQRDFEGDTTSVTERPSLKSNIEHKTDADNRVKDPKETAKARRDSEDNFNSQGKETVEKQSDVSDVKLRNTEKTLSGRDLTETEKEVNNKFRGDQFDAKNSFNESIPQEKRKELVDANAASTCKLNENLDGKVSSNEQYQSKMSDAQKEKLQELRDIRKDVAEVNENTVMQKIITEDAFKHYMGEKTPTYNTIQGCVSKAEDVAPYTNNMTQSYENLRLDFKPAEQKNPYIDSVNSKGDMYVMRFTSDHIPGNDDIPKSGPPCTESGCVGSDKHLIPEYEYPRNSRISDGALYIVDHDGNETMVATWNKKTKQFDPVE